MVNLLNIAFNNHKLSFHVQDLPLCFANVSWILFKIHVCLEHYSLHFVHVIWIEWLINGFCAMASGLAFYKPSPFIMGKNCGINGKKIVRNDYIWTNCYAMCIQLYTYTFISVSYVSIICKIHIIQPWIRYLTTSMNLYDNVNTQNIDWQILTEILYVGSKNTDNSLLSYGVLCFNSRYTNLSTTLVINTNSFIVYSRILEWAYIYLKLHIESWCLSFSCFYSLSLLDQNCSKIHHSSKTQGSFWFIMTGVKVVCTFRVDGLILPKSPKYKALAEKGACSNTKLVFINPMKIYDT